ncbi:MAG: phenylalanine--tRNA ligase subunit alpha [Bacteroidetes bacterium]|nr:MAG: phenylalanine--tRNA ligase subunit alpha [Bacteroidota bacterium]
MKDKIRQLSKEIEQLMAESHEHVEELRIRFLSKKGLIPSLFADFRNVAPEQRKEIGQALNTLKQKAGEKINELKSQLELGGVSESSDTDLSRPAEEISIGSRHPISLVRNRIISIFQNIGFNVSDGPEMEDDWHNFSALNFPPEHPARDMQDTFFIEKGKEYKDQVALRTHTSSVQVRVMETTEPPIRTLSPGRVFRNEAISARSHCIFHQVEGLYVDKGVSFADLKQTLYYFATEMFGEETRIRFRPSYFPFTEPSAEMDISCILCKGKGCNVCKYTGWLEIMGCGMVDPAVLKNCGIDPEVYSGFAFGMGIERVAMMQYAVKDIRYFFENDQRFLKQFTPAF